MKKSFIFLVVLLIAIVSCKEEQPRTMKVVAGNGQPGFWDGDSAELNKPIRFAPYAGNSVLFADINNHAIRVATLDGKVTTIAGGPDKKGYQDGTATEAKFNSPHGVGYDKNNDIIYVAEASNHTIRKITKDENGEFIVSTVAGVPIQVGFQDGETSIAKFISPHAVVAGNEGVVYVADIGNTRIRKIKDGIVSTVAENKEETPEDKKFKYVMDIVFNGENIFMADAGNNSIFKVVSEKLIEKLALNDTLSTPHGIAVDKNNNLYIADMGTHRILKINSNGDISSIAGTGIAGAKVNELNKPAAVLVHNNNLWIADLDNHQIKVLQIN